MQNMLIFPSHVVEDEPASKRQKTEKHNTESNEPTKRKTSAIKPVKCDVCKQVSK